MKSLVCFLLLTQHVYLMPFEMTFYCNHFAQALGQRLWKDAKGLLLWCTLNSLPFSGQEIIRHLQFVYRSFRALFKFCLATVLAFLMQSWHSLIHTTLKKARVPLDNPSGALVCFLPKEIITALYTAHLCEHKVHSVTVETQGAFTHLLFCFVRINYHFSLGSFCLIVKRAKAHILAGAFLTPLSYCLMQAGCTLHCGTASWQYNDMTMTITSTKWVVD